MVGKEAYERTSTFKELAIKNNIAIPTIQLWKNNYAREFGLPENFNNIVTNPNADKRIKELENENLKLRIEIERLKRLLNECCTSIFAYSKYNNSICA